MQDLRKSLAKYSNQLKKGEKDVDFYFLLRLIETLRNDLPRIGFAKTPDKEAVRLGQKPYLHFPSTSIASITGGKGVNQDSVLILVYFLGMLGTNGPMPLDVTSYIYQRAIHEYDASSSRFLDIINHRIISLYYRAFAQNEIAISFDRKDDPIRELIKSLTGQITRKNSVLPAYTIESLSPFLSCRARSKDGLVCMLQNFFNLPIKVNDFKEKVQTIPKDLRLKLSDSNNAILGVSTQLGAHYYSRTKSISIEIGPMSFTDSFEFMPKRKMFLQLCELVNLYIKKILEIDLVIKIKANTIEKTKLNGFFALGQSVHLLTHQPSEESVKEISINVSSIMKQSKLGGVHEA